MRIHLLSDTHFEMHRDHGDSFVSALKPDNIDVLVLAGDITTARFYETLQYVFLGFLSKYKKIVYLPGNHEYYQTNPDTVRQNLDRCVEALNDPTQEPRLHILWPGTRYTINGERFIGGTGWFPEPVSPQEVLYKNHMNDFRIIDNFEPWVYKEHKLFVDCMDTQLQKDDIVVSHHMPTQKSVHPKYKSSGLNCFFVFEMDDLIVDRQPKLWMHGHSHEPTDHMLGDTRVVSNPIGYPHEFIWDVGLRRAFEPLLIEI